MIAWVGHPGLYSPAVNTSTTPRCRAHATIWLFIWSLILPVALLLVIGCGTTPSGPDLGQQLYTQALEAKNRGDMEQARIKLEQAIQADSDHLQARRTLGELYRSRGQFQQALPHLERAAALQPRSLSDQYNLGVVYQMLQRFEDAARAYIRALDLSPRDVRSNMNLGLAYMALGDLYEAVHYLRRATNLDPTYAAAWTNLGVGLDAIGQRQAAESVYRRALELDGESIATLQNLTMNLISQGRGVEAVAVAEQLLSRGETAVAHRRMGDALAAAGRFQQAMEHYDAALRRDPRYFPALNAKASALIEQYRKGMELDDGLRQQALVAWRQSLRINSNQPRVSEQLKYWENPGLFAR